ncbi:MAG TPA: hypothetical protein VMW73_06480 [Spirochaetia bacterium]|nr:hypothetical protein [Spirochaetia bacterium]
MDTHVLVLLLVAVIVGALIATIVRMSRNNYNLLASGMAKRTRKSFEVLKPCPICRTMLRRGETVHSVVFGKKNEDTITHIFGCPYCYPQNSEHSRVCPVCRQELSPDGYLIGRMFERRGNGEERAKRHVHVLGCTECRGGRGRASQAVHPAK